MPETRRTTVHAAGSQLDMVHHRLALMLIYRRTRRKITSGRSGGHRVRTARPLDERCGGDPDAFIRIVQGRQLAARDERADAGDRQTQPTGGLGQGECGPPVDPHHRSHCARNGPRGPGPMHEHLHEQAGRWVTCTSRMSGGLRITADLVASLGERS